MATLSSLNPFTTVQEKVTLDPQVADEIKYTTCYMCACRCGIKVYLKNGKIRYIEGNPNHPINKGVLCAKGSAGIMNHYSPARLTTPLLRVGERGKGEFKEIDWDEALKIASKWLSETRANNPSKLVFFTGRDQSQSLTGWWAAQYGTNNFASHGGFCSVNMAVAGLYSVGGAFWEFGETDWHRTKYFMLFGVAEDHDSNPIKIGLGQLKARKDAKFISVNPVRTGYSAIADEWLPINPGTDGLLIFALINELLKADKIDSNYLARYTNASYLIIQNPGAKNDGLFWRDADNQPGVMNVKTKQVEAFDKVDTPLLVGSFEIDGVKVSTVFELMAKRYLSEEYSAEAVAKLTGIDANVIKRIAAEIAQKAFEEEITIEQEWTDWRGKKHDKMIGRPVSFHAMRGISAHSNGFQTCRALHLLQILIGSIDVPGGWRYKAPYPKPAPPCTKPAVFNTTPNQPLQGMPMGDPTHPDDLLVDDEGNPQRIDKAYSWEYPLASHGLMHMVLHNAWAGDPYPIDVLMMYMANMAWNSAMNIKDTVRYLTDKDEQGNYKIPKFIYSDAYYSETVAYADLILPDTVYLERHDCISLLDRAISSAEGPADAIRVPIQEPNRNVRPFQEVLLELGARLSLPGMVDENNHPKYQDYADYIVNHERTSGIGPLAGWRGKNGDKHGKGEPNPKQLERYVENSCFWQHELELSQQYFKPFNQAYLKYANEMGWLPNTEPILLQIYSEHLQNFRLAATGHGKRQVPEQHSQRVATYFDPLPFWYQPFEQELTDDKDFPLHAITQRPMHMYHSWGSQNAWLRQITNQNFLYIHVDTAKKYGLKNGDWAWLSSHHSRIRLPIKTHLGVNKNTVWTWNAIGKRRGAWGLKDNSPEQDKSFLLNYLISDLLPPKSDKAQYSNSDPVTGQAAWYDLRIKIEKCTNKSNAIDPIYPSVKAIKSVPIEILSYGADLKGKGNNEQAPMQEFISHKNFRNL